MNDDATPSARQQEASKRHVVAGDGLRAMLDRSLRPRRARHRLGAEREVALGEAGGTNALARRPRQRIGNLNACRLHPRPFRTVTGLSVRYLGGGEFAAAGLAAASLVVSIAPASASGGSGGGGGTTTATTVASDPIDPWAVCPDYIQGGTLAMADGSTLFANTATVGCLVARNAGGSLSIYEVTVASGWSSSIRSSDANKVDVQFSNPTTGERHQIRSSRARRRFASDRGRASPATSATGMRLFRHGVPLCRRARSLDIATLAIHDLEAQGPEHHIDVPVRPNVRARLDREPFSHPVVAQGGQCAGWDPRGAPASKCFANLQG